MTDEQFAGETTIDEEGRNATQRRMEEEGTIWNETRPADLGEADAEADEEAAAGTA